MTMHQSQFRVMKCKIQGITAVEAETDMSFQRHTHDQFGIGILVQGAQKSLSGRGIVDSQSGDVITVNPGEVHDGLPLDKKSRRWRMLYFDTGAMADLLVHSGLFSSGSAELAFPVLRSPDAAIAFRYAYEAALSATENSFFAFEEAIQLLLPHLSDRQTRDRVIRNSSGIDRAIQRMQDDPTSSISLAELAEISGLERFRFIRVFSVATGLTPYRFLLQERVHMARRLIGHGGRLSEIAFETGFADQAHMTRHFVRNYGYTPGQYASAFNPSANKAAISFKTKRRD